jgi:hypothetical protein
MFGCGIMAVDDLSRGKPTVKVFDQLLVLRRGLFVEYCMVRRPVDEFAGCWCPMMLLLYILPVVVVSKTAVQEIVQGGADILVMKVDVSRGCGKMEHRSRGCAHLMPHSGG